MRWRISGRPRRSPIGHPSCYRIRYGIVAEACTRAPERLFGLAGIDPLDTVACDFPELRLIGIHIGIPWTGEMIAMAWKHHNVFIGSDAHAPKYWPECFVHYIDTYGQDKVIFGTDFPVLDFERTVAEIDALGLREIPRRKLVRDNVLRVYGLES